MIDFIKEHKWLCIIVCAVILVVFCVFVIINQINAPELDHYERPRLRAGGKHGGMRFRMDEAQHSVNDDIVLTVNTAFCNSEEQSEKGLWITLYYWGGDVFDAVYPNAEKHTMTEEEKFNFDFLVGYDYYTLELPHESVNPKDLVFTSNSDLIQKLVPSVVPYEFQIPLTVREDAPYEEFGELYFFMEYYAEGDLTNDQVWDDHYSSRADGSIYFYKIGDQIYFSGESSEDAKKMAE